MSDGRRRGLLDQLTLGPAFLLLGQRYLALDNGRDPLLPGVLHELGVEPSPTRGYDSLLNLPPGQGASALDRMARLTRRLPVPHWLEIVAQYPWNGVLSSAVDSIWMRALTNEWRTVQPVLSAEQRIPNPRSALHLQAVFLFGGVERPPEEQPPLDRPALAARRQEAMRLLQRLPDGLLTPRGVLLIEGYGVDDWLRPEDLFGVVSQLAPGQGHLFSATDELLRDEYVADAVRRGLLVSHPELLAGFLSEANQRGALRRPAAYAAAAGARVVRLAGKRVLVPRDKWNGVLTSARPIDEDLLRPRAASPQVRYQRFRDFLGSSEGRPDWRAYADELNFVRDFETRKLRPRVEHALRSGEEATRPILVAGQAATGKSVALAALAHATAAEGRFAVLHIERRPERPGYRPLDDYCQWAESEGAPATLIVWDGMVEPEEYFDLWKRLVSRGRRVVLVGSTYVRPRANQERITADASLVGDEPARFLDYLGQFGVTVRPQDRPLLAKHASWLAALYRLLPEARRGVQEGLVLELRDAVAAIGRAARRLGVEYRPPTAMAEALIRSGLVPPTELFVTREDEAGGGPTRQSPAERLMRIVMVPGRYGLLTPLDLVLRVLGREGVRNLVDLLRDVDIIRWYEDENCNYQLGPRNALEAMLLTVTEYSTARAEAEVIADLFEQLRPDGSRRGGSEVQFAVDLIVRVSPRDSETPRFNPELLRLSRALSSLRSANYHSHPRLMLPEANLARRWVKYQQRVGQADLEERLDVLSQAEQVVEEALEALTEDGSSQMRLSLLVELSSIIGSRLYELIRANDEGHKDIHKLRALLTRVSRTLRGAREMQPWSYYPVDVLAWVSLDVLNARLLPEQEAVELLADTLSALTTIDPAELSESQAAMYYNRQAQIAQLAGESRLARNALRRLAELDSPAAHYLLALRTSGLLTDAWNPDRALGALRTLQAAGPAVAADPRCLRLMLDLLWLSRTGRRFLAGERETVPFDQETWEDARRLAEQLRAAGTVDTLRVDFLRAIALFHLGLHDESFRLFHELDVTSHELVATRRVVKTYLASMPDGSPARFGGFIRRTDPGRCWVNELQREIPFLPVQFPIDDPRPGQALPDFYIAFNFRGPIAEPARPPGAPRGPSIVRPIQRAPGGHARGAQDPAG